MHGKDIRVFPYTVNSLSDAKRFVEMGVDGFFTDDPALMTSLLYNWLQNLLLGRISLLE